MKFELVIDSRSTEVVIALLKEGRLIELHKEKHDNDYSVGDIYLGKVKKIKLNNTKIPVVGWFKIKTRKRSFIEKFNNEY